MSKTPTKPGLYYAKIDGKETVVLVDERMQCRHFDGSMFGPDNPVVQWLGEAVPTVDELRQLCAKQGPEGWTPVTYEKGNIQINYNWESFVVFDTEDECWLTPLGEWKLQPKERATFPTPTEAAKAAEKAGEQ